MLDIYLQESERIYGLIKDSVCIQSSILTEIQWNREIVGTNEVKIQRQTCKSQSQQPDLRHPRSDRRSRELNIRIDCDRLREEWMETYILEYASGLDTCISICIT